MAYYILVTGVSRPYAASALVSYELRSDGPPDVMIENGTLSVPFADPSVGAAARRQSMRETPVASFKGILDRATTGDADFAALSTALAGFRYPPAP